MEYQWLMGLSAGDGLQIFRRLNQCELAGDGLARNRLAVARNGCGLQVQSHIPVTVIVSTCRQVP